MRWKFYLLALLPNLILAQQNKSRFELGLQLDNDSFVSTYNDFYYTNGIFLFGNYVSKKSSDSKKIVNGFKIGQEIYNPRIVKAEIPEDQNRPYAGYLFAEYSSTKMHQSNQVLKMAFRLGLIGPDSKAEDIQNWIHDTFGFGEIAGWNYQVKNLLAVQFGLDYSTPILSEITSDRIDFHLYAQNEIGTAFVGFNAGTLARISLSKPLTAMQDSNFYNGLGSSGKELYFYILPKINLQLYDATIQGSMFNQESPVTFNLKPLRFKGEAGLRFKYNDYNLSFVFNYSTDQIKNSSTTGFYYGSLVGSYTFK